MTNSNSNKTPIINLQEDDTYNSIFLSCEIVVLKATSSIYFHLEGNDYLSDFVRLKDAKNDIRKAYININGPLDMIIYKGLFDTLREKFNDLDFSFFRLSFKTFFKGLDIRYIETSFDVHENEYEHLRSNLIFNRGLNGTNISLMVTDPSSDYNKINQLKKIII